VGSAAMYLSRASRCQALSLTGILGPLAVNRDTTCPLSPNS
jgi:hypothetical protein